MAPLLGLAGRYFRFLKEFGDYASLTCRSPLITLPGLSSCCVASMGVWKQG